MVSQIPLRTLCALAAVLVVTGRLPAQTVPPEGIRNNTPAVSALVNARIIPSPGRVIERGCVIIRNGIIEAAGEVPIPADARVFDLNGNTVYAGFIDASSDYGMPKPAPPTEGERPPAAKPSDERGPLHWNPYVLAHRSADRLFTPDPKTAEKLRAQGFTSVLTAPSQGLFNGISALVSLGEARANELVIRSGVAQHVALDRDGFDGGYPGSLMGMIALIRQTLLDAQWYRDAVRAYAANPSLQRPEQNEALAALGPVVTGSMPLIIDVSDEQGFLRADRIAREFNLPLLVRGSGHEYKRLEAIRATDRAVILPVNVPDAPAVATPEEALQVSLAELRYWDEAPENPARLSKADVTFALTTATLRDPDRFLSSLRRLVERGLSRDAALAALTTTPARLLGVGDRLGTIERGKIANLIIASGDLFSSTATIRETWVDGRRYEVKPLPDPDPRGRWDLRITSQAETFTLNLKGEPDAMQGSLTRGKEIPLTSVLLSGAGLSLSFAGDSLGMAGLIRMTAVVGRDALTGSGEEADGDTFLWSAVRTAAYFPPPDTGRPPAPAPASLPPSFPHGEYGRTVVPSQADAVFVNDATIWTSGPQGVIGNGDMIIRKGKIVAVGRDLEAPPGAVVIQGAGMTVTPGLIDAHSHMAVAGSVNEAGQAISAEVRIGDVLDANDIGIYRALAGGLTVAHVLHGSANPIGGQSQLIKLRWGMLPEELKFKQAPPTIKFALGENVKQSNWGDRYTTRYPQTRMGVEESIRDEFSAAIAYERRLQDYDRRRTGIPPRRDLQSEAMLEILRGKRDIHCHSYRQDEILMLMRLGEEIGFTVRVFQHILEGYKVADVMAKHGAGGSSFSDWWAYKLEVYDAIPHNGALMHDQGVLVSFNSDSDEMARRMNLEAAKAVKYGGLSEQDALNLVTINAARQLKVDDRVGSLETGKDADFVVWSGHPLSTYTRCEQTWIDGRRFFDRGEDAQLRKQIAEQRAVLIQKVLSTPRSVSGASPTPDTRPKRSLEQPRPYSCREEDQQ